MVTTNLSIFLRTVVVLYTLTIIVRCNQSLAIESQVERALLNAKWEEVYKFYESRKDDMSDPVARMIMAHASLATNDNNLATVLFLSLDSQEQFESWAEYTDLLLENNPENPIALYLSADASARLNRLDEAVEKLTKVLKLTGAPTVEEYMMSLPAEVRPDLTAGLAYNALGAVYDLKGQKDHTMLSLMLARQWAPNLADAYASYGQHLIFEETSGEGVEEAFKKALEINPGFALAYNGLGCVYFGRGEFENAGKCFERAMQASPALGTLPYSNRNLALLYASMRVTLAAEQDRPGMNLEIKQKILKDPVDAYQDITLLQLRKLQSEVNVWVDNLDKYHKLDEALNRIPQIQDPTQRVETMRGLIKENGWLNVAAATVVKEHEWLGEVKKLRIQTEKYEKGISKDNMLIGITEGVGSFAEWVLQAFTLRGSFLATDNAVKLLSLPPDIAKQLVTQSKVMDGALAVMKGVVAESTPWPMNPLIKGISKKGLQLRFNILNPSSAINVVKNSIRTGLENDRSTLVKKGENNVLRCRRLADNICTLKQTLQDSLGEPSRKPSNELPTEIAEDIKKIVTSNQPIDNIGRLLNEHESGIRPGDTGLIVSNDPFRRNLAADLMINRGVIPKTVSPFDEAVRKILEKQDYKVAIALPKNSRNILPPAELSGTSWSDEKKMLFGNGNTYDTGPDFPDNYNRVGVSEPGLAERAALANKRSVLLNNLRWGSPEGKIATEKELREVERHLGIGRPVWDPSSIGVWEEYVPKNLGPNPGGIRTSDIGKAFTDKGNWPVATIYSLAYNPLALAKKETE